MGENDLIMLPVEEYVGVDRDDPIRQYNRPVFGKLYKRRVELCLEQCAGGDRVLEVGYGTGVSFLNLSKKYREIYGVDLKSNADQIAALFESKGLKVALKQGDLLDLPYPDNFFDTVLLISILEHLRPPQLERAFSEIWRVLRPGGQVVFGVPVESPFTRIGFLMLGYDIRKHHFSTEKHILAAASKKFTQKQVQNLFFPLTRQKVYEVGHFIKAQQGAGPTQI